MHSHLVPTTARFVEESWCDEMEICKTTGSECGYCMPGPCDHRSIKISADERQQILQSTIDTYGAEHQVDMAIEEMAELIKALLKMRRPDKASWADVLEEIVDVQIMLDQLKIIYDWSTYVEASKLARLQEAIKDAQES